MLVGTATHGWSWARAPGTLRKPTLLARSATPRGAWQSSFWVVGRGLVAKLAAPPTKAAAMSLARRISVKFVTVLVVLVVLLILWAALANPTPRF